MKQKFFLLNLEWNSNFFKITISELKQPTIKIRCSYRQWYCKILILKIKMKEEEKFHKKNSGVSSNRTLSVADQLRIIKHAEERSIHSAPN